MNRLQKIFANTLVTGAITGLAVLGAVGPENITMVTIYAAAIAGAISALKEYQEMEHEKSNRGKREKDGRSMALSLATIF